MTDNQREELEQIKDDLVQMLGNPEIRGYSAGEEIEEAIPHLESAIVDLKRGEQQE